MLSLNVCWMMYGHDSWREVIRSSLQGVQRLIETELLLIEVKAYMIYVYIPGAQFQAYRV